SGNGGARGRPIGHRDEAKAAWAAGLAIGHDPHRVHRAIRRKEVAERLLGGRKRQVAHKDVHIGFPQGRDARRDAVLCPHGRSALPAFDRRDRVRKRRRPRHTPCSPRSAALLHHTKSVMTSAARHRTPQACQWSLRLRYGTRQRTAGGGGVWTRRASAGGSLRLAALACLRWLIPRGTEGATCVTTWRRVPDFPECASKQESSVRSTRTPSHTF